MFQEFSDKADPGLGKERVAKLRDALNAAGLDGFIVPRADEHQGEYVPACAERLAWLTGFTGSAGTAVILPDKAALFTDSRYTLQARRQSDTDLFDQVSVMETSVAAWLKSNATDGMAIGCDPWLTTRSQVKKLQQALEAIGAKLVLAKENPIDQIWTDRPEAPLGDISLQPLEFTGVAAREKSALLAASVAEKDADAAVLTDPASIAWAFNIRGSDIPHTPAPLAFAILRAAGEPELFVESAKLSNAVRAALEDFATIRDKNQLADALADLGAEGARVLFDPDGSAGAIANQIEQAGGTIVDGVDPVSLPRARKSPAEIEGARRAHIRDAAAFVRFLAWFDSHAAAGELTEISVVRAIEEERQRAGQADGMPLEEISFDTIAGSGPNGAIVHYRVTETTDRAVGAGELLLVDSGAQYRDGTTDITRTILVADAPDRQQLDRYRRCYTCVLRAHVAVSMAQFPKNTTGVQIDALARSPLWSAGLDFDHGTGHGVGSFLAVHEGPQRFSRTGHTALEPGMIVSNEPGYYVEDAFGIRIENLVVVMEQAQLPGGDRPMHSLQTLTLVPYDRRLIATNLMTPSEIAWVDAYHARIHATLSGWPDFGATERRWLAAACRPLVG